MKPDLASLSFVLHLLNTKGIHQRTSRQSSQPLMSLNGEVQTPGDIQTFSSFLNTELKGLYSSFYLKKTRGLSKTFEHFLHAMILKWPLRKPPCNTIEEIWMDRDSVWHIHGKMRLRFTQLQPQQWCKHGLLSSQLQDTSLVIYTNTDFHSSL